jgi:lipid II isoglutaminyl synthase (glutamine-hydrolysing)
MKPINIVHIYPKEMNIYGDNGNILILQKRLEWRGIAFRIMKIGVGEAMPSDSHIVVGGGGQDAGQNVIAEDLKRKTSVLSDMANAGIPMLMICGMYQMFGHYFKTQDGNTIPGMGILDIVTEADDGRIIGNITSKTEWGAIVGYENHSGRTKLGPGVTKLGVTKKGQGNNGLDETEGARQHNVFGSYLHGPVLARSPQFADYLLTLAIVASGQKCNLDLLDDTLEATAVKIALSRPR